MHTPIFYKDIAVLDKNRHGGLSIAPTQDLGFTAGTNSVILLAAEFTKACREYPIVFVEEKGSYFPAAILGLRDRQNLFLSTNGGWKARYLPAYVRRYPFIPAINDAGNEYFVCIDETFTGFNREGRGERLFLDDGTQSPMLQRSIAFLKDFQREQQRTADFCATIARLGLLEPMRADVAMNTGEKISLTGFHVIKREKCGSLDNDEITHLFRNGDLELIYAHLFSLETFESLMNFDRDALAEKAAQN